MLNSAIVGCGRIARVHLAALQQAGLPVCAFVDPHIEEARCLERVAPGANSYPSLDAMLNEQRPDVVHVCTPPRSHAQIAMRALAAQCHVLVEKPIALSVPEVDAMDSMAQSTGHLLSTCHHLPFTPSVLKMRELIERGAIGNILQVFTYYGVDRARNPFVDQTGDHWAWQLPGGVFTDVLPHVISLHQTFLGSRLDVTNVQLGTPQRPNEPPSELAALVRGHQALGTIVISFRAQPYMKYVEVLGERGTLRADLVREVCVLQQPRRASWRVEQAMFNLDLTRQLLGGTILNAVKVVLGRWPAAPGLHSLIRNFYDAIEGRATIPISMLAARSMVDCMESIWAGART